MFSVRAVLKKREYGTKYTQNNFITAVRAMSEFFLKPRYLRKWSVVVYFVVIQLATMFTCQSMHFCVFKVNLEQLRKSVDVVPLTTQKPSRLPAIRCGGKVMLHIYYHSKVWVSKIQFHLHLQLLLRIKGQKLLTFSTKILSKKYFAVFFIKLSQS